MTGIEFKHIKLTGMSREEILEEARNFKKRAKRNGYDFTLQEAVDATIDARIEAAQSSRG
jgi:hypothetical protein